MRCVDVNLLVYAHRPESPDHSRYAAWLDAARRVDEPLGVPTLSLSGFVRVVTHPRVFKDPTPLEQALAFADVLRAAPNHVAIEPGPRHWSVFVRLSRAADVRGNLVPDAYLAAMAVERGAVMCTADRGFARFDGLRWRHPFDDPIDPPAEPGEPHPTAREQPPTRSSTGTPVPRRAFRPQSSSRRNATTGSAKTSGTKSIAMCC